MKTTKDLVDYLNTRGATEEEISSIVESVGSMVSAKYYAVLMDGLTKEDIEEVNNAKNNNDSDYIAKTRFKERTGRWPHEVLEEMTSDLIDEFIENFKKQDSQKPQ
jgi:hypothetical protein